MKVWIYTLMIIRANWGLQERSDQPLKKVGNRTLAWYTSSHNNFGQSEVGRY